MSRIWSLLSFLIALILVFFSINSAFPPGVSAEFKHDSLFCVSRAYTHLTEVTRAPHSTGTPENARVRQYIIDKCKEFGFEVSVQNSTVLNQHKGVVDVGNIYNVVARKRGTNSSKAIMLMAHYDSDNNTPAAGDDGVGVAAMLESARALSSIAPLQNDLVLLFTDGEEIGLLGARAFVDENPLIKDIGLVINFEGRGNSGPSNMFEVNAQNGWVINEYSKSAANPFANSLGYEIYKKLPNATDFTLFKEAGITGLNNAYIDGFANYHSPNDKPANMNLGSFQHHGENMLSLTKHFANLSITNTKAPDVSYFNLIGSIFIYYPASFNVVVVGLVNVLFLIYLLIGVKRKSITIKGAIISTVLFPVVLGLIYFAARYLLKLIISAYPYYTHFDENNSYNSGWYFLAMTSMALTLFGVVYMLAAKKINFHSLFIGILSTFIVLMNLMQYAIPSASYLIFIPLIFVIGTHLYLVNKKVENEDVSLKWASFKLLSVVPTIFLFSTTVYFAYVAFALGKYMPYIVIGTGLFSGLMLPVLFPVIKNHRILLPLSTFICFIGAIIGGHLSSGYSEKLPLQSSISYRLDADSSKASWVSDYKSTDKWSLQFFNGISSDKTTRGLIGKAPVLGLTPPNAFVKQDTHENGLRKVTVHFTPTRENAYSLMVFMTDAKRVKSISIDGKKRTQVENKVFKCINYIGVTEAGFDIIFEVEQNQPLELLVCDRSIGLPAAPGFNTNYPKDIVAGQGSNSNTTQVSKTYFFNTLPTSTGLAFN